MTPYKLVYLVDDYYVQFHATSMYVKILNKRPPKGVHTEVEVNARSKTPAEVNLICDGESRPAGGFPNNLTYANWIGGGGKPADETDEYEVNERPQGARMLPTSVNQSRSRVFWSATGIESHAFRVGVRRRLVDLDIELTNLEPGSP